MTTPSWGDIQRYHCGVKWCKRGEESVLNPFYEEMATRRYNYSASPDTNACRLVFLKNVLKDPRNKTLVRYGRFIWCRNLQYGGRNTQGLREISFTVDKGQKRFRVAENNVLCIPAKTFVNNNRYFRYKDSTFKAFSSVFGYKNTMSMMCKNSPLTRVELEQKVADDNPHKPGTLVSARLGYFYPTGKIGHEASSAHPECDHPYGIILAPSVDNNDYAGREFYRVQFGETIYERVHPIQMEIIHEV